MIKTIKESRLRDPGKMAPRTPRFSLLVCSVDRVCELDRLFESLAVQTDAKFDVVLVDQNEDNRLNPILEKFEQKLLIRQVRSARGLSRARNIGLQYCSGEVIGFPDDDCWYPPDLLERVWETLARTRADFLTGRWQDEHGRDGFGRWPPHGGPASAEHVWTRAISFTIFCRRTLVERIGQFDERLGVGAGTPWGAGEETDYLLRALESSAQGWHEPACIVYHPRPATNLDERALARALSYARGTGFVLRKHRSGIRRLARSLLRPVGGAVLAALGLDFKKARFHLRVLRGRCVGIIGGGSE